MRYTVYDGYSLYYMFLHRNAIREYRPSLKSVTLKLITIKQIILLYCNIFIVSCFSVTDFKLVYDR
jgi:hypothetical protein